MTKDLFQRVDEYAHGRAETVMSTGSSTTFEWAVTLSGVRFFAGIASQLRPECGNVYNYDKNAVLYYVDHETSLIRAGSRIIHSNLRKYKCGDIIRFRFQPQRKKLAIDAVRNEEL